MIWPRIRTIPTATLPYPAIGEFDFRSILFESNPVNERAHPRYTLFPPPSCGGALVNRCFVQSFPYWSRRNGSPLLSKRTKGKEILGSRRNDDASTAANTPRLIRLERGRGGVSSPPFSVREDSAQNVVAWLRANASRFSGVDSPPGTNEAKGRGGESKESIFLPLPAGRIDGGGCSKGTDFFSRSRSARPELSTNFSLVFSRMGHDLRRNFNEYHAATRMLPSIRARSIDFANRFP